MKIWVTSDTHFGHDRDFIVQARGFSSVKEMNEAIVQNWNSVVAEEDTVYHLGDVILGNIEEGLEYFKRLNGNIILLEGNHDSRNKINRYKDARKKLIVCGPVYILDYKRKKFYLSHYPTVTENMDDKGWRAVFNLYGHTHQKTNFFNDNHYMYHVGVDSHNCTPVLLDDIIEEIQSHF